MNVKIAMVPENVLNVAVLKKEKWVSVVNYHEYKLLSVD